MKTCLLSSAPPGEYVVEGIFLPRQERIRLAERGILRGRTLRVRICRSDGGRGVRTGGRTLGMDGELCAGILLRRSITRKTDAYTENKKGVDMK